MISSATSLVLHSTYTLIGVSLSELQSSIKFNIPMHLIDYMWNLALIMIHSYLLVVYILLLHTNSVHLATIIKSGNIFQSIQ